MLSKSSLSYKLIFYGFLYVFYFMILKEFQKFNPIIYNFMISFPSGSEGKYLPAKQQNWVQSLGQEDPLEKRMATHSSILACRIPWTENPGRLQSKGSQRVGHD